MVRASEDTSIGGEPGPADGRITPEERARRARARFKKAAADFSLVPAPLSSAAGISPIPWTILALTAGFILGFSPTTRRSLLNNVGDVFRSVMLLRL